jgi:hypothetical protein
VKRVKNESKNESKSAREMKSLSGSTSKSVSVKVVEQKIVSGQERVR